MTFMELCKSRYSVRKFTDKQIEQDKLDQILEAGNVAPTAKNIQPHRIYVVQSEEGLAKMASLTRCHFDAKTVLIFTYDRDEEWKNPLEDGVHSGVEDVSIVATQMMLEAAELGIGTTWVNVFPNTELEKAFDLPASERSVLIMPMGYPAEDATPSPMHGSKKDISEIVRYI